MKRIHFTAFLLGIALLTGCKKDTEPVTPTPLPEPEVANPRIAIKLNPDYLSAAKIDSATMLWEIGGLKQEAKMQLSNDTLFTETAALTKGAGRLTVQIFSKVILRWRNLQWEKRTDITLKEKRSVNWAAPATYDDAEWNPRVIMIDGSNGFTAIVGLRPTDPYFLMKNIPAGYMIEHDRNYTRIPGGAEIVAGRLWKCNTVCTDARGIIEDREFFRPLATQIAGKEWKMVETGIGLFGPNNTSGGVFYFNHW